MKRIGKYAVIALLACVTSLSTGCLYLKNHPLGMESCAKDLEGDHYEVLGAAEGTSSSFTLLWMLPVTTRASYDDAINEAIRSQGADNLIDVTMWREKKVYVIGTVDVLHVKGKAIRYSAERK